MTQGEAGSLLLLSDFVIHDSTRRNGRVARAGGHATIGDSALHFTKRIPPPYLHRSPAYRRRPQGFGDAAWRYSSRRRRSRRRCACRPGGGRSRDSCTQARSSTACSTRSCLSRRHRQARRRDQGTGGCDRHSAGGRGRGRSAQCILGGDGSAPPRSRGRGRSSASRLACSGHLVTTNAISSHSLALQRPPATNGVRFILTKLCAG